MKNHRLRNAEYVHIKEVLSSVIRNCRKESNAELSKIRNIWNSELDRAVTEHAQPSALRGATLLITVKSSTLAQQLRFLTHDIIRIINQNSVSYRISELKIKTGTF